MDRADLDASIGNALRETQTLRPGIRKVEPPRDAAFEEIDVLGPADYGDEQMYVVYAARIDRGEAARQKIGLLLIVALDAHSVTRTDDALEDLDDVFGVQGFTASHVCDGSRGVRFCRGPGCSNAVLTGSLC